jgi:hypothetical protein
LVTPKFTPLLGCAISRNPFVACSATCTHITSGVSSGPSNDFGDVVIESDGIGDYSIIEDYSREINEWLLKTMK